MKKQLGNTHAMILATGVSALFVLGQANVLAQDPLPAAPGSDVIDPVMESPTSDFVTINVKNANISEVLKAYSLQTGQSIVVGPDVVSDNVNVRLNNIPWQDALDVILKPYGFGYRIVGDTIVISKLENIVTQEGIEPLASKVFTLKYLDAYDIKEICEAQLSSRGKLSILKNKGLPGWEFGTGGSSGSGSSQTSMGSMKREKGSGIEKSKTLIVTDVPSNVSQIEKVIDALDRMPSQVLIESRFIEIGTDDLMDLGLDFATGENGLTDPGVQTANNGNDQWGVEQNDSLGLTPSAFNPATETLNGALNYNAGLQLLYSRIGGSNFEMLLHALEEKGDANVLSAPRVLTQNNQEAAILVGEKFPIIESQNNSGGVGNNVTSTTLKYYENIGIQLNVIPQVCADDNVNMIVHPVVSSIDGYETGVVSTGGDTGSLTRYPRLKVREAQTQVMLKSEDTIAIGGLQDEVKQNSVYGVPFLKDIPYLGRLFRRETTKSKKIDLIILIKASVVDHEPYAEQSVKLQQEHLAVAGMAFDQDRVEDVTAPDEVIFVEDEAPVMESAPAEAVEMEPVAVEEDEVMEPVVEDQVMEPVMEEDQVAEPVVEEVSAEEAVPADSESQEMLSYVNSMDEPADNVGTNAQNEGM